MNPTALILAGGDGTRFWPLSRRGTPKHLLHIAGGDALINQTARRIAPVIGPAGIYVVTNRRQAPALREILWPRVPRRNILVEPEARNTAPAILFALRHIARGQEDEDGVLCVLPADHLISDTARFQASLTAACRAANEGDVIVALGLKAMRPATGFGYLKPRLHPEPLEAAPVERFVEKPDAATGARLVASGYRWNSGIYAARRSVWREAFQKHTPALCQSLCRLEAGGPQDEAYAAIRSVSIDCAVMEKADNLVMIPAEFDFRDIGSWNALCAVPDRDGNHVMEAEHVGIDSSDCVIHGNGRLIATIGVNDLVIVQTDDAILVCDKKRTQEVGRIVELLAERGKTEFL